MPNQTIVFDSTDLQEKSEGLRFALSQLGEHVTGFVIRYEGVPYAYINQCAHMPVELDWKEGEFFTADKDNLICATHGAQYVPNTGHCIYGPCIGNRLQSIPVTEENEQIIIHIDQIK